MTAMDTDQRERFAALMDPNVPVTPRPRAVKATHVQGMHHKLVADVEPQSQLTGEFLAKVSDYGVDRQNERFARHAFDPAIARVKAERRVVPVLFGHDTVSTESIVGYVPSDGWEANDEGLFAHGHIDVGNAVGLKLHRMLQKNALRWSVGFTVKRTTPPRNGDVRVLEEVGELFELSIVPIPANSRTTTLSIKSDQADEPEVPTHAELEQALVEHGIITIDTSTFDNAREEMLTLLGRRRNGHEDTKAVDPRPKATGPVQIATFDC